MTWLDYINPGRTARNSFLKAIFSSILTVNLRGEYHKEVGAPKMESCEAHGLCPDAPVFFNLFTGFWTGDHPPRKYYTPRLSKVKDILLIELPTKYAKRH